MKKKLAVTTILLGSFALTAMAQDWYRDRDSRFRGNSWHGHVFEQVRSDLDHIYSARFAADRERNRLDKTRQQLADLQMKLEHNRYDGGELDDVIASLAKSSNDDRLSPRDRNVLSDDANRLREYRANHDRWH